MSHNNPNPLAIYSEEFTALSSADLFSLYRKTLDLLIKYPKDVMNYDFPEGQKDSRKLFRAALEYRQKVIYD